MNLVELIGARLKSAPIVELLEQHDLEVVYEFDRLHENTSDAYSVSAPDQGFELRFDENQRLEAVFIYPSPRDGFAAIQPSEIGVATYATVEQAQAALEVSATNGVSARDVKGHTATSWVRADFGAYTVHHEYRDGVLALVTIAAGSAARHQA